ncbi:response regulator [Sphingobacteriaceae bacterium]|nr:response regulator [Sphingobacteriaceae bacterium]
MSTIFYTDDDADDIMIFEQALKEVGDNNYNLKAVEDGQELIDSLNNPPPTPNVIFLDLNMPGKDGRETLKEIKSHDELKRFPVIILSTSSSKEDIDLTYHYGASLYVNKPRKYSDLKKLLATCLRIDWKTYERPAKENFFLKAS